MVVIVIAVASAAVVVFIGIYRRQSAIDKKGIKTPLVVVSMLHLPSEIPGGKDANKATLLGEQGGVNLLVPHLFRHLKHIP